MKNLLSLTTALLLLLALFSAVSCSERFEAMKNPYGRAIGQYPDTLFIPAEGGILRLSFESNFFLNYYVVHSHRCQVQSDPDTEEWRKLSFTEDGVKTEDYKWFEAESRVYEKGDYYQRMDLTLKAERNTRQDAIVDTLEVYYRYPTFILPVYATGTVGSYIICQEKN